VLVPTCTLCWIGSLLDVVSAISPARLTNALLGLLALLVVETRLPLLVNWMPPSWVLVGGGGGGLTACTFCGVAGGAHRNMSSPIEPLLVHPAPHRALILCEKINIYRLNIYYGNNQITFTLKYMKATALLSVFNIFLKINNNMCVTYTFNIVIITQPNFTGRSITQPLLTNPWQQFPKY
jgi:hypothetical protein